MSRWHENNTSVWYQMSQESGWCSLILLNMDIWYCFLIIMICLNLLNSMGNLHIFMHQCFIVHIDCFYVFAFKYHTLRWFIKTSYYSFFPSLKYIFGTVEFVSEIRFKRNPQSFSYISVCLPTKVIIKLIREKKKKIDENSGGLCYQFSDISFESSQNAHK